MTVTQRISIYRETIWESVYAVLRQLSSADKKIWDGFDLSPASLNAFVDYLQENGNNSNELQTLCFVIDVILTGIDDSEMETIRSIGREYMEYNRILLPPESEPATTPVIRAERIAESLRVQCEELNRRQSDEANERYVAAGGCPVCLGARSVRRWFTLDYMAGEIVACDREGGCLAYRVEQGPMQTDQEMRDFDAIGIKYDLARWLHNAIEVESLPAKGKTVRVVRGRKVKIGTEGKVIWTGTQSFRGRQQSRIGFVDASGETHWTAESNVEVIGGVDSSKFESRMNPPVKGNRVRHCKTGFEGFVFWVGEKSGVSRLGVRRDGAPRFSENPADVCWGDSVEFEVCEMETASNF